MTKTVLLSAGIPVAVLALAAGALGQTRDPFICMYGHSDDPGVTDAFRKIIPPLNVIEGTSKDAAFIKELRTLGAVYAAHVTNPESATAQELLAIWRSTRGRSTRRRGDDQRPGGRDRLFRGSHNRAGRPFPRSIGEGRGPFSSGRRVSLRLVQRDRKRWRRDRHPPGRCPGRARRAARDDAHPHPRAGTQRRAAAGRVSPIALK